MKKLSKIYEEILDEDLEYAHSDTKGEEDDEFKIGCETSVVPFNTELSEGEDEELSEDDLGIHNDHYNDNYDGYSY
jgi:hypothetical protein